MKLIFVIPPLSRVLIGFEYLYSASLQIALISIEAENNGMLIPEINLNSLCQLMCTELERMMYIICRKS